MHVLKGGFLVSTVSITCATHSASVCRATHQLLQRSDYAERELAPLNLPSPLPPISDTTRVIAVNQLSPPPVSTFTDAILRHEAWQTIPLAGYLRIIGHSPGPEPSSTRTYSTSSHARFPFGGHRRLQKVLVANRGEIACRVLATARRMGIPSVAVYSEADRGSRHVAMADEAVCIGGIAARDSYLRGDTILQAALSLQAGAIHPGYGFLSENADFSDSCAANGIAFVGPPGSAIRSMGSKSEAKKIMTAAGVPVVPGYHGDEQSDERLLHEASLIGFPLLVKAVSGGGGKGMKIVTAQKGVAEALQSARREARGSFGDDRLLLERYITRPRHVEVQVFADSHGNVFHLFDRDCSLQRRHQKVIEEAPAPHLTQEVHDSLGASAVRAARAVGYVNAGTVEFILDTDTGQFFFMEMNTRLQVEHPVTEAITGLDLVEWQLAVAAGQPLPLTHQSQLGRPRGHAFEARLYAESPRNNFLPGAGTVLRWRTPQSAVSFTHVGCSAGSLELNSVSSLALNSAQTDGSIALSSCTPQISSSSSVGVRVDSGVSEGDSVGTNYDPMIAKIVSWGPDRNSALAGLHKAMSQTQVAGLSTNLPFLLRLSSHPDFAAATSLDTTFIPAHASELMAPQHLPPSLVVLAGVAKVMLKAQASSPSQESVKTLGPWAVLDSKRLGHSRLQALSMTCAAAGPTEAQPLKLEMQLTWLSDNKFDVNILGGPAVQVQVRHAKLLADLQAASASASHSRRISAEVDGLHVSADVLLHRVGTEEVLNMWTAGDAFEFRWPLPSWSKDAGVRGDVTGAVVAPMSGRVAAVLVSPGMQVAVGTPLVMVEAMKMEHAVVACVAGKVGEVLVASGQQVAGGQLLLHLDTTLSDKTAQPSSV